MKKRFRQCRQLIIVAACFLILVGFFILPVKANEYSGKTGEVKWNFENRTITISGSGQMDNYSATNLAPWHAYRDDIEFVVIEKGVTMIGNSSFVDCPNLKNVKMADTVEIIGNYAFMQCEDLTNVNVSSNLKYIGEAAFKKCYSLIAFEFPEALESICDEAFFMCESLVSVNIPSNVYRFGNCLFSYCESLIQATINASISWLPDWTFYGCESLSIVYFSSSISDIGDYGFYNCDNLEVVESEAVGSIRDNLTKQIKEDVKDFDGVVENKGINDQFTINPNDKNTLQQDAIENENIILGGSIEKENGKTNFSIDVVLKDDKGYSNVIEKVDQYIDCQQSMGNDSKVNLNVSVDSGSKVSANLMNNLAGKNVQLTLIGDSIVVINCNTLDPNKNYGDLKLGYVLEKVEKPSKNMMNVIGNAEAYKLQFTGSGDYKITLKVLLGREYALNYATIYQKDGVGYNYLQNVQIDQDGYASFYFDGFDNYTTYLIGMNVSSDNALIPEDLYDNYGGLMDEHGNKYEITGVKSKWGISIGQLTLIVIGGMVLVIGLVGGAMFMMFKRRQANEKIRKEVMSEGYSKEENIKKYKPTKKWFEKKKK